jgi:hypothetical protein
MGNCSSYNKKRKRTSSLVLPYIVCNVCSSRVTKYSTFTCQHKICYVCLGFFSKNAVVEDRIYYNHICNLCKLQDFINNNNINNNNNN